MANHNDVVAVLREAFEGVAVSPRKEVPAYNGTGNIKHWLVTYRLATENKSEAAKLTILFQAMTGVAHTWFCSTRLADEASGANVTSDQWIARLTEFFGKTQDTALDELEGRRQKESEKPVEYVRDVLRLCAEVDPSMTDATKLRHLHRGLLHKYAKDMLLMDPKDPAMFQAKLVKLDSASPSQGEPSDKALFSSLLAHLIERKTEAPALAAAAVASNTADESQTAMFKRMIELQEALLKRFENRKPRTGPIVCFNCKEEGHISRTCPHPRVQPAPVGQQAGNAGARM